MDCGFDEAIQAFEFPVNSDAQGHERSRGGMNLLGLAIPNRSGNQISEVFGSLDRLTLLTSFNNAPGDPSRASLFSVFKDNPRDLFFRKSLQQLRRSVVGTGWIHAHIQRRIEPETESTFRRIKLQRRDTKIYQDSVRCFRSAFRHHSGDIAEVCMHCVKPITKTRKSLGSQPERFRIDVEADHPSFVGCFEYRFSVASESERAIHNQTTLRYVEKLNRLS